MTNETTTRIGDHAPPTPSAPEIEHRWEFFIEHEFDVSPNRLLQIVTRHSSRTWDEGEVMMDGTGQCESISGFDEFTSNRDLVSSLPEAQFTASFLTRSKAWSADHFEHERSQS